MLGARPRPSLSSVHAHVPNALTPHYDVSKAGIEALTRSMALYFGRFNVRVNAVAPGPVATAALVERMTSRAAAGGLAVAEALRRHAEETAPGRMVTETDVAQTVLYLLGPQSGGLTGQMLTVDAGKCPLYPGY